MKDANVTNENTGEKWLYSETVKEHFFKPQNILLRNPDEGEFDAHGSVGSPACGDVMDMWIKIQDNKIIDLKWRTFGCASAIASTSIFSVMIIGMETEEAKKIRPQDIIEKLGGLPDRKIHCSVLADQAFHKALENYYGKDAK